MDKHAAFKIRCHVIIQLSLLVKLITNIWKYFSLLQRLTFDTIAKCGFGLEADSVRTHDDEYLQNCRGVINDTTKRPILFMFGCKYISIIIHKVI